MKHNHYNRKLKSFASGHRNSMNKAEACLWKYVLKAGNAGTKFNRQRPVLNYIADFMSKELKLIIEVDGYSHSTDDIITRDEKKQKDLEGAGYTIIRFSNNEVLKEIDQVRNSIQTIVQELKEGNRDK